MFKSLTYVIDSWVKPIFTFVKTVVLSSHQVKLDCIVRYVNQIWIKQANFQNSKFISYKFLNYFKWTNVMPPF